MQENTNKPDNFDKRVEKKVVDKLSVNYKVTNDITTLIARLESMNIVVAIINAFLGERQKGENKLTDLELAAIQNAVSIETKKTQELYDEIDSIMKKEKGIS